METSVYTSLFNVDNGMFDIPDALENWSRYADEIVVGTLKGQSRKTCAALSNMPAKTVVVEVDTDLDDPFFDGRLKNGALQACTNKVVIQQDFDERIGGDLSVWEGIINYFKSEQGYKAGFIPVIDLYKDLSHYKSLGMKWYVHLKEGTYRGPVNFALRGGGFVDTDQSDTCELIDIRGELIPAVRFTNFFDSERFDIISPHIIHLGYLDLKKRVENNKFWQPVWTARKGSPVSVATDIEQLEDENEAIPHNLREEWWK